MAMGALPFGIVPFAAVKFAGYSMAGFLIQHGYSSSSLGVASGSAIPKRKPWLFGVARTALGIVAGASYAFAWQASGSIPDLPFWWLYLVPVRLAEWAVVIGFFFDPRIREPRRLATYTLVGALWSYILDVPALLAVWATPGAAWIC